MAEAKSSYPMITEQRWWRLRDQFKKSLPARVTPAYLQSVLAIGDSTAGGVEIPTLKRLGLIDKDSAPSELAKRWRDDEQYGDVCDEIRSAVYPAELLHAAPDPVADEQAAIRWFMNQGEVGEQAALKMARSYRLLVHRTPKDLAERTEVRRKTKDEVAGAKPRSAKGGRAVHGKRKEAIVAPESLPSGPSPSANPSLHIDVQIHISADAKSDQIDQIFSSMAKHLYGRNE